jgi:hypothetical protein
MKKAADDLVDAVREWLAAHEQLQASAVYSESPRCIKARIEVRKALQRYETATKGISK